MGRGGGRAIDTIPVLVLMWCEYNLFVSCPGPPNVNTLLVSTFFLGSQNEFNGIQWFSHVTSKDSPPPKK